jgi:hypothetical protein
VLQQCWVAAPRSGRTALLPMVRHLVKTLHRTSVTFLVSDFMTDEDLFASRDLAMLAARHDVIGVVPEDPLERELPAGRGFLSLRDLENGHCASVALSPRTRRRYSEDAARRREALTRAFYRVPMDHVFVPTDQSPVEPLLSLFAKRMRS